MVMRAMRAGTKPILWIVVVAFLGTIIFAWGMDWSGSPASKGIIARVDGEEILQQQYLNVFNMLYQQKQQENPTADMDEATLYRVREDAFNQLVSGTLFAAEIKRYGIEVTQGELAEHLRRFPPQEIQAVADFQTDGQFDYGKYQQQFQNPDPRFWVQVESFMRPRLAQLKLSEQIALFARVSDPEVKSFFEAAQERVSANIAHVRAGQLLGQIDEPTEAEIADYYEAHKAEYRRGEIISLHLINFPKAPSRDDSLDIKRDIEELIDRIEGGEEFAELAQTYSEDVTAANGGDLGWFRATDMVKPFGDAVKAMETGAVSEPVLTSFGWHLIKLDDTREIADDTLEYKAAHILLRVRATASTLSDLRIAAEDFAQSAAFVGFDSAAIAREMPVKVTGEFERGEAPRNLGREPAVENWGFQANIGDISDPFDLANAFVVCLVKDHQPAGIPPLEGLSTNIKQSVRLEKATDLAYGKLLPVWEKMQAGASLTDACADDSILVLSPPPFGRYDRPSGIGDDPIVKGVAFSLTPDDSLSGIFRDRTGASIIELISRSTANLNQYAQTRDSLYETSLQSKQQMVYNAWYVDLLDNASIEDFRYQVPGGGI